MEPHDIKLIKFFEYSHLPEHLQGVSKQFYDMAHKINNDWKAQIILDIAEATAGMRKLLEAKDCIVRAHIK